MEHRNSNGYSHLFLARAKQQKRRVHRQLAVNCKLSQRSELLRGADCEYEILSRKRISAIGLCGRDLLFRIVCRHWSLSVAL